MTSAPYSRQPPTIAPTRLTPKAVVGSAVSANRDAKTTFAVKIGRKATATEASTRHPNGSPSSHDAGTTAATARAAPSAAYPTGRGTGRGRARVASTASSTATRTPANTIALTSQVVPNSS